MTELSSLTQDLKSGSAFDPDTLYEQLTDKSTKISSLMCEKSAKERVRGLIVGEIQKVLKPYLALPHFNPDLNKQQLEYYDGKCWLKYDVDRFFRLVRMCAEKVGLPPEYETSASFMRHLYLDVAHALHEPMSKSKTDEEMWVNVQNGVLKISVDGHIMMTAHKRDHYFHYVLPYGYDHEAKCSRFEKYLSEVLPDADTRAVVQEFTGYGLVRSGKAEKMLALKGKGANGKSVLINILREMYGKDNVSDLQLSGVTTNDEKRRMLEGKLMNFSTESGAKLDYAVLKQMVSGEPVDIRELYHGTRTMTEYGKFITAYNDLPKPEQTNAFFRRWILVPFKRSFEGKDADKDLARNIIANELPGILNWAIEGLIRLVQNDFVFTESQECVDELRAYSKSGDSVAMFLDECCKVNVGTRCPSADVVEAYKFYCYDNDLQPLGKKKLYQRLKEDFNVPYYEPSRNLYFDLTLNKE